MKLATTIHCADKVEPATTAQVAVLPNKTEEAIMKISSVISSELHSSMEITKHIAKILMHQLTHQWTHQLTQKAWRVGQKNNGDDLSSIWHETLQERSLSGMAFRGSALPCGVEHKYKLAIVDYFDGGECTEQKKG
ncbi:hypothetical protein CsSME_00042935 [Camellia sinensis var. sinensis]